MAKRNTKNIIIRRAVREDLNSIWKMICILEDSELDRTTFSMVFFQNINDGNVFYFVAEDDSTIVGFASMHIQTLLHHDGKVAEVQELYVDTNKRGKGIGTLFLHELKKIEFGDNCILLEVSCNIRIEKHMNSMKRKE